MGEGTAITREAPAGTTVVENPSCVTGSSSVLRRLTAHETRDPARMVHGLTKTHILRVDGTLAILESPTLLTAIVSEAMESKTVPINVAIITPRIARRTEALTASIAKDRNTPHTAIHTAVHIRAPGIRTVIPGRGVIIPFHFRSPTRTVTTITGTRGTGTGDTDMGTTGSVRIGVTGRAIGIAGISTIIRGPTGGVAPLGPC